MRFKPSEVGGNFIKPGRHILKIADKVGRGTSNSGKDFLEITLQAAKGGTVKDTFYLTDAAMFRLANLFDLVGADMDAEVDTDDDGDMRKALGGKLVGVIVEEESYTKKDGSSGTAAKVKGYFPASEGAGVNGTAKQQAAPDDGVPF